jgi:phenol 2-monooxygenase (NADPH)
MIIPREGDLTRVYVQLGDRNVIDSDTGKIDKERVGPNDISEVKI